MKIIANRAELLALCRRAARLANDVSPLEELCGFLLEADADTGQLSVSATNLEVSLQGRIKADIREGGSLVLNGKMGVGMLSKLPGELVVLCDRPNNTLLLAGGKAKYTLGVLPGRRYPPLELPFPADTVQVSGVPAMARRTVFAASDDKTKMAMQCVNLVFSEDGLKAVSSDGSRVMSVKGETKDTGAISMMIPARSLALLAGMCTDEDVFHVGTTGKSIVYMKENFIFSARRMDGEYINTDALFSACKPQFTVLTDGEALYAAVEAVTVLGNGGVVELAFGQNAIALAYAGEDGSARGRLDVVPLSGTPAGTYYYAADKLKECLKAMGGTMRLQVAERGMLVLGTEQASCLSVAMRGPGAVNPKRSGPARKAAA